MWETSIWHKDLCKLGKTEKKQVSRVLSNDFADINQSQITPWTQELN